MDIQHTYKTIFSAGMLANRIGLNYQLRPLWGPGPEKKRPNPLRPLGDNEEIN